MGEGSRRGIEIVGFCCWEVEGVLVLVLDGVDGVVVRSGRPAMEAWIVDVGTWRWVPGPGR